MSGDKVYLVTGANRGVGYELVNLLSSRSGVVILATARKPEQATQLKKLADERQNIHILKLDVTSQDDALELAKEAGKIVDGIDTLILNSGIAQSETYVEVLEATSPQLWLDHYTTNTLGPILTFQALYPLLLKRSTRQAIFVSTAVASISIVMPAACSAYGQSKAALNYTARYLSSELADEHFTIIPIHPGAVGSDMGKIGRQRLSAQNEEMVEFFKSSLTPEESAKYQVEKVFDKLTFEDNGKFYNYDGTILPW